MNNGIEELYQELIIDHARKPKNFGSLVNPSHHAQGHNPLCGDIIELDLKIEHDTVQDVAFHGDGCAISKASASLMTEIIRGKSLDFVQTMFHDFHALMTHDGFDKDLGKLSVLKGVRQFPMRVKCATLCWHTLHAAIANKANGVTTE